MVHYLFVLPFIKYTLKFPDRNRKMNIFFSKEVPNVVYGREKEADQLIKSLEKSLENFKNQT